MNCINVNKGAIFRSIFKTVTLVFKVAPYASILKLLQQISSSVAGSACLISLQNLIDCLSNGGTADIFIADIILWAVLLSLFTLLSDNINYFGARQTISIQKAINEKLNKKIISKLMTIDYPAFEQSQNCDIFHRLEGDPAFRIVFVFQGFLDVAASIFGALSLSIVLSQGSWILSFVLFLVLALLIYIESKAAERKSCIWRHQSYSERRLSYLENLFCSKQFIAEIALAEEKQGCIKKWRTIASSIIQERVHNSRMTATLYGFNAGVLLLWISAVIGFSGLALVRHHITLGVFVALIGSIKTMAGVKQSLAKAFRNMTDFQRESETINDLMSIKSERSEKKDPNYTPRKNMTSEAFIKFESVTFAYSGCTHNIIENLSFTINAGEKVALVGDNGVGKSTIIKLLAGLYEPDDGVIRIGDNENGDKKNLTNGISFVFQDFAKYYLTLRQNVALSHVDHISNDTEINSALKKVNMEDILNLDQLLGKLESDGIDLSGGEWQRIALARAFFKPHQFIVFDEPTASLDPKVEKEMYELLLSSLGSNGCLLISHRLASARLCDRIIVLSKNGIEEMGSHDELMKKHGVYYKKFKRQASWYCDD